MSFWAPERISAQSAWLEHAAFAFWLVEALRPRTLVELGTYGGFSYFVFCEAVQRLRLGTRCHAVDTFAGDAHTGFYGEEVFAAVKSHNDRRYAAFSTIVRSTFDEALEHFTDGTIDLLHIDGRHFYEDVKHDFESWRPRLSQRAVVLFHDTNERERGFGVFRLWDELCDIYPHFEFFHGHGLGVLGVGTELTPKLRALFTAAGDDETGSHLREAYSRLGAAVSLALRDEELNAAVRKQADELERLRGETHGLRERIADADTAAAAYVAAAREELASRIAERDALEKNLAARSAEVARLGQAGALALERANDLEQKLAGEATAVARLTAELASARDQVGDLTGALARLSAELARGHGELATTRNELMAANERTAAAAGELTSARSNLTAARDELAAERARSTALKTELAGQAAEAARLNADRARTAGRAASLASALGARELDVQSIWASTSWRLTHPARLLGRRMPRLAKIGRRVVGAFFPVTAPAPAQAGDAAWPQHPTLLAEYRQGAQATIGDDIMAAPAGHAREQREAGHDKPSAELAAAFDEAFYLDEHPDVAAAVARGEVASGWEHYCKNGRFENRMPSASPPYSQWVRSFHTLSNSDVELIDLDIELFKQRPKISVMLLRAAAPAVLQSSLKWLSQQIYRNFEIIIPDEHVDAVWHVPEQSGIELRRVRSTGKAADEFNAALDAATGELLIAVDAGDALAPHALYLAARHAVDDPRLQLIYSDEDELTAEGHRANPFFKPGWNPELILAFNYIGKAVFCRTDLIRSIGGARVVAGEAWRWDLILRASERTLAHAIRRIPFALYHEAAPEDRRRREVAAGVASVGEAIARRKQSAAPVADPRGWLSIKRRLPDRPPHVTIIIPTRDRCDLLRRCVAGLLERTAYPSFDVTIIDNNSKEKETIAYLQSLRRDPRISVIPYKDEFNFATMHNRIIPSVRGEVVALLNNDVDVIGPDWLEIMVAHALDPQVGVVGAKLYHPGGTIQHAGIVMGLGGAAGHMFHSRTRVDLGPAALLMAAQDVSAVTGACMVLRRSVFAEIRGFNEAFAIDYNDVDFCLRLQEHGYRVVWAADAALYHLEGATRGSGHVSRDPAQQAKRDRFQRENARFKSEWKHVIDDDPYYNPNLTLVFANRSLAVPPRVVVPWQRRELRRDGLSANALRDLAGGDHRQLAKLEKGVAVIGLLKAEVGVGQAGRSAATALEAVGYPHSRHTISVPQLFEEPVAFECQTTFDSVYGTALIYLNADTLVNSTEIVPLRYLAGKRRIGFWHWELPVFPHAWVPAIDMVDEIWTPSRFVAESIRTATHKPIRIIPHPVSASDHPVRAARERLGLPQDGFLFLSVFDTNSYLARKNPEAVVRAFIEAFPQRTESSPVLVLKCHGKTGRGPRFGALLKLIANNDRIILIDRVFSTGEMTLLFSACDALVSLHRSEGYGLNLAEAMACGKLAIATGFSGNVDFMTDENSILIPFTVKAVGRGEYIFGAGQWWAEPSHAASVEAMRLALDQPAVAAKLAQRACRDMAENNSYDRVGRLLVLGLEGKLANVQNDEADAQTG